jgi:hypothetical protein
VKAQLRIDEPGGNRIAQSLMGTARYPISGGPLPVQYANGKQLNCPDRG